MATAADFIRAGASAIGVGADLVDLKAIREGRGHEITENARKYLEIVSEARGNHRTQIIQDRKINRDGGDTGIRRIPY